MIPLSCARLVPLEIGAVTPGCAISQASATCAGVASWRGHGVERLQIGRPRASK